MPRHAPIITCTAEDMATLTEWSHSRTMEVRMVERTNIVLHCLRGEPVKDIAEVMATRPNTVIKWRDRFVKEGLGGLLDRKRTGKPCQYTEEFRNELLAALNQPPPPGQAQWDGPALAQRLNASKDAVWRVLRKERICLSRQRSWCVSTDPEFAPKAADIIGLYLNPPLNALVISVDEKPSIQALERRTGYVQTDSGKVVRGYKSTYKRHGTLNLFAALEIATGAIHTQTTTLKRRVEFLAFMDQVLDDLPSAAEIHVIVDNYCIHKKCDTWLASHPQVTFHYTPTSASWLNLVEVWFGILSRKALRGASFRSTEDLRAAIEAFIAAYGATAKPFVWRKREVRGSQLCNTIANYRN